MTVDMPVAEGSQLYQFGGKYNDFFGRATKIISRTLMQPYRDMLKLNQGTALSLPRDAKVWDDLVTSKFEDNLALIREVA